MYSDLIGKIKKAKLYAQEKDRMRFYSFNATFTGEHDEHKVGYQEGNWSCTCAFFDQRGVCSHTMAIHDMLDGMLTSETYTSFR